MRLVIEFAHFKICLLNGFFFGVELHIQLGELGDVLGLVGGFADEAAGEVGGGPECIEDGVLDLVVICHNIFLLKM